MTTFTQTSTDSAGLTDTNKIGPLRVNATDDSVLTDSVKYTYILGVTDDAGVTDPVDSDSVVLFHIETTFNADAYSPGIDIVVFGINGFPTAAYTTVVRNSSIGLPADKVRGFDKLPVSESGDIATQTDFEYTFRETSMTYTATLYDSENAVLATITSPSISPQLVSDQFPYNDAFIRSISQPALTRPVAVQEFNQWGVPGNVLADFKVLGRKNRVVITDAIGGRNGSMTILSCDLPSGYISRRQYELLFFSNTVFMFQAVHADQAGYDDMYFRITDCSVARTNYVGPSGYPILSYTIQFTEVDRPATINESQSLATWQNILDFHDTWQDVLDTRSSWFDVLNRARQP